MEAPRVSSLAASPRRCLPRSWDAPAHAVGVVRSLGSTHALARSRGSARWDHIRTRRVLAARGCRRLLWVLAEGCGGYPASGRLCRERPCRFHFPFSGFGWLRMRRMVPGPAPAAQIQRRKRGPSLAGCLPGRPAPDPACGRPSTRTGVECQPRGGLEANAERARVGFNGAGVWPPPPCDPGCRGPGSQLTW